MRITFVAGPIGSIGGVSRVIRSQAEFLVRKGHEVSVVVPNRTVICPGARQFTAPYSVNPLIRVANTSRVIGETRPDIILAHVGIRDVAAAVSGLISAPLAIYSHGGPFYFREKTSRSLAERFYSSPAISLVYRAASLVITNSRWCSETFERNGIHAEVVYPGVDSSVFLPTLRRASREILNRLGPHYGLFEGRPVFVTVGFGSWKRNELLIDALGRVRKSRPDVLAIFIGRGQSPQILAYANGKGLASNVILPGPIFDDETLRLWYSAATSYVHMFGSEQFGLPIAEAQSCGTAAIGPNSGGAAEIIEDRKTGLLFSDGDPESLAQRMLDLIEHPSETDEMGEAARDRVLKKFDFAIVNRRLEILLEGIMRKSNGALLLPSRDRIPQAENY